MKLPQLSLCELFLLVLVAACLCAWWRDRSSLQQELDRRKDEALSLIERKRQIAQQEMEMAKAELLIEQAARRSTGRGLHVPLPENLSP